jgi:hypothetical protein
MSKPTFLIVCDSRGRGLKDYINKNENGLHLHFNVVVRIKPGKKLEELQLELTTQQPTTRHFRERTWDHAIIAGGICNLTERTKEQGIKYLRYTRDEANIQGIIDNIRELRAKYNEKLNIPTIPPACLLNYYIKNNVGDLSDVEKNHHEQQQTALEEDLERINSDIINVNATNQITTIHWAQKTYSSSLKKKRRRAEPDRIVKLKSSNLPDGVHPDETLKKLWFKRVTDYMWKVANSDNYNSDSQTEEETWNYKRRPKT